MNIDLARWVDRWVGVPLCWILSVWDFFRGVFAGKASSKPVQKILLIKLSELGAIILAYPLIQKLKKTYPSAELFFLTFERNRSVFKIIPDGIDPDKVLLVRENPFLLPFDILRVLKKLYAEKIDIVLDLEFFSRISALISYLTGAPKRSGYHRYDLEGLYRGNLLTHRIFYNPLQHVTHNFLRLAVDLEKPEKRSPEEAQAVQDSDIILPKYVSTPSAREAMASKLKAKGCALETDKIFLLSPGEGMLPLREWPLENFVEVARKLLEKENHYVVLVGTQGAEKKTVPMMKAVNHPRCVSVVGQTSLEDLMELYGMSEALISNDCGLVHLAMMTSVKKVVLFGPETPAVFGPLDAKTRILYSNWPCSPCLSALNHRKSSCRENWCLKSIPSGKVFEVMED